MSEELKPCPFCGSAMTVPKPEVCASGGAGELYVICDCGAMGVGGKTIAEAVAAWNRRATPSTIPASEDGLAEVMLRSVYLRPDLSAHAREQFIALMKSGVEEVTVSFGDFRTMARAALASTRTASKQEIVTAGDCMARWLYGLSQSEAMPESWRTTCAELAQAWKGTASGKVNAGAARQGGNTCKESGQVDVEAERKLCASAYEAIYTGRAEGAGFAGFFKGWLAKARTQADAGKDAALREAVGRLIKAKGRFHTEQNYKAVVAAYDATTKPENT